MLSCKQAALFMSQAMDGPLPFTKRYSLYLHLAMCNLCRFTRKQFTLLRCGTQELEKSELLRDDDVESNLRLSEDCKERIKSSIRQLNS